MIILATGLVLAGCSDDTSEQDGLLDALGTVRATAETKRSVEYGQPAAVRALVDQDKARYQTLQGFGYSRLAMYSVIVEDDLALDLDGFDEAISVGEPPTQATVLRGEYDVDAVNGKLRDLGVDDEVSLEGTRWHSGDDYEMDFEGPFAEMAPPAQLNNIATAKGSFAFAPAEEGIQWVTQESDATLADDNVLVPMAKCLGDVIAAQLQAAGQAVGVREDGTEVICLTSDQAAVSDALKGDVPSTREPWDELLPGAEVDEDNGLARVTVPAAEKGRPVGRVLRLMLSGDLDGLR